MSCNCVQRALIKYCQPQPTNTTLATRINSASTSQWQHTAPSEHSPPIRKTGSPTLSDCSNTSRLTTLMMPTSNALSCSALSALLPTVYSTIYWLPQSQTEHTFKEIVDAVSSTPPTEAVGYHGTVQLSLQHSSNWGVGFNFHRRATKAL